MANKKYYESLSEKDKKFLSANDIRQLDLLSKYHEVDFERRIVTLTIKLEKATELINTKVGSKSHPVLDAFFLETASDAIHALPADFKLDFKLEIDDYEGYDPDVIFDALKDSLELFNYDYTKEKKKNTVKMSLLIFIGVFIFSLLFYLCSFGFIKNEVSHNIIHEVIYTVACVLLWEGVYILFLPDESYNSISGSVLTRIDRFIFADGKGKILHEESFEAMKTDWVHDDKKVKRSKRFLLFFGTGAMVIGAIIATDIIEYTQLFKEQPFMSVFLIILTVLTGLFTFATGACAVSYYANSNKLTKFLKPLTFVALGICGIYLALYIANAIINKNNSVLSIVLLSILICINIGTLVSLSILEKYKKNYVQRYL